MTNVEKAEAILAHYSKIDSSPGLRLEVIYTIEGCREAPESGADWADELDYLSIGAEIRLPREPGGSGIYLHPRFLSDSVVFGERLSCQWGVAGPGTYYRYRKELFTRPKFSAALEAARAEVAHALAEIEKIATARTARFKRRHENSINWVDLD